MTGLEIAVLFCEHSNCSLKHPCATSVTQASKIEAEINAAGLKAREQCVKIVDDFAAKSGNDYSGGMANVIAQAIRAL